MSIAIHPFCLQFIRELPGRQEEKEKTENSKKDLHFSGKCANILEPSEDGGISYPGVAKFGIALEWGSRGLEFESRHSDHRRQKVGSLSDNYQLFAYIESNHFLHMWLKMCSCCIPIADTIIAHLLPKFHKFCHISGKIMAGLLPGWKTVAMQSCLSF